MEDMVAKIGEKARKGTSERHLLSFCSRFAC